MPFYDSAGTVRDLAWVKANAVTNTPVTTKTVSQVVLVDKPFQGSSSKQYSRVQVLTPGQIVTDAYLDYLGEQEEGDPADWAAPTLTTISPATAVHGAANLTVTATGTGFISGEPVVLWGSTELTATVASATSLTFTAPISTASAGTVQVKISQGGKESAAKAFTVT